MIFIPTLRAGGAEKVATILANNWSNKGHNVVLCIIYGSEIFQEINTNVKVIALDERYSIYNKSKIPYYLRLTFKKESPDIIQSFLTEYNILCLASTICLNIPIFVSDRASPLVDRGWKVEFLRKLLYMRAAGVIAQTNLAKDILLNKINNKNIIVIPNPVKLNSLEKNYAHKRNVILNVGRLVAEKGQLDLIKAFVGLGDICDSWELVIVGEGPERERLEKEINLSGLTNIRLVGQKSNVDEYYCTASIFAFTSFSEGFPNALAEAMSYGLPVVSYDCIAGPRDLIDDGSSGFLIGVNDINGLANILERLILNADLRNVIGTNASNRMTKNSDILIAEKWLNFISL